MHAVVGNIDHVRLTDVSTGWNPSAVADLERSPPGAAIVAPKGDQATAVQRRILECQLASADRVQPHMAQGAATDDVGAGNAHVRVHSGEMAVLEQDVLAEVGSDHAPARAVGDVVHPTSNHCESHDVVRIVVVGAHADRLTRRADGRVDFVPGGEAVAQRDVGTLLHANESGIGTAHGCLADDIVGQTRDFRVRAGDHNVPIPVVVTFRVVLAVGERGKDAAAQIERPVVDWSCIHPGDQIVFPIDVRLHRAVSTQDEAVVLGNAFVLVEPPPDILPLVCVFHEDMTVVLRPRIHLSLVSREPIDLQFLRLQQRAYLEEMRPVVFNLCVVNRETGGAPVGIGCDHGGQRPAAEMVRRARLCPDTQAVRVGVGVRLADRRHVIRDAVALCTESLVVYQAVFEIHGYLLLNAISVPCICDRDRPHAVL